MHYYANDHLGTPQKLVASNGGVGWSARMSAFGITDINANSNVNNPLRFAGQYADGEVGYFYNFMRRYDPIVGRYLQTDPLGLFDGANTYSYAYQNPLRNSDPTGEFVPIAIGFIIGAGLEYFTNPCATVSDILLAGGIGALGGGLSKVAFLRYGPKSLTREHGKVWSHSIARKMVNKFTRGKLNKSLNTRGGLNGSWVNPVRHHLHDKSATIKGGGRKLPLPLRALDRIPDWLKGTAASGAAGSAVAGCECN